MRFPALAFACARDHTCSMIEVLCMACEHEYAHLRKGQNLVEELVHGGSCVPSPTKVVAISWSRGLSAR